MLLPGSIFLALFLLAIFTFTFVILQIQNKFADRDRIDICALTITATKRNLFHFLIKTNKQLRLLKYTVYSARNAAFIPPIAVIAKSTEQSALIAMRALQITQELKIKYSLAKQAVLFHCKKNKYSKKLAACKFTLTTRSLFYRSQTLYTDVPGELKFKKLDENKINCTFYSAGFMSFLKSNEIEYTISKQLEKYDFDYKFKK